MKWVGMVQCITNELCPAVADAVFVRIVVFQNCVHLHHLIRLALREERHQRFSVASFRGNFSFESRLGRSWYNTHATVTNNDDNDDGDDEDDDRLH